MHIRTENEDFILTAQCNLYFSSRNKGITESSLSTYLFILGLAFTQQMRGEYHRISCHEIGIYRQDILVGGWLTRISCPHK